ncbi:helix-turn-helix domain-containing protein [Flavobacterium sp. LS1R47]|uniref:Helix-turn-helix domain-containing protein n=1 Tax=Flavobacterium frigoritolerans TaxID=2987686 RepID=A0A9X2ZGU1_9FLAO|nr:helix-turn-helix domain-containing protein [Flavobacterium frigoritolerans]MCV9931141.1 helix-turn-helix domain-containing protein [Flavobacterium frigoritolerans]
MRLKIVFYFLIANLLHFQCYAQDSEYDKIYSETAQVLVSTNPKKALTNTNLLYRISKNNSERIKACMLRATVLRQYDINNEAIRSLMKADSLATIDKNYAMLSRINGFLSTLHREIGIPSLGKTFLEKALNSSKKIKDKDEMFRFQGNLHQELAYYEIDDHNYNKANAYLRKGNKLFEKISSNIDKPFHLAVNSEVIAKNYLAMHQVDSALVLYKKALNLLSESQSPESPLKGFIYNGLGNVYTAYKEYPKAKENYIEAEKIAETSKFHTLQHEVYNSLLKYYKQTKNNQKYVFYSEKYNEFTDNEEGNRKLIADNLISTLHAKEKNSNSKYKKINLIIITICILAILVTLGIYAYKRKQDYKKFKDYISKKDIPHQIKLVATQIDFEPKKDTTKEYMSQETEESILKKIEELEQQEYYLGKETSLNVMAAELGINHRYLSYVINKHKEKDFANYINELRINYIVDRLQADPNFLKYKISYLGEKCGFSSHSRFTIIFKKVTGLSPLAFITYLKEEPKADSNKISYQNQL